MPQQNGRGSAAARTEADVLDAIERRRRRPARKLLDEQITLAHGAGGRSTHALIEAMITPRLANPLLAPLADSAVLELGDERLAFTTDSYVVKPLFFPGGDIGELAVNGTINDLAMAGARPLALSLGLIVEEGLPIDTLDRVLESVGRAAKAAAVPVATGDTKVVERGGVEGLYINTSGIGAIEHLLELGPQAIRPGDVVLVSGAIGDHGTAIMLARGDLELEADLASDTAPLHELAALVASRAAAGLRCMRDPTRGGVATVLVELALAGEVGIAISEASLPVRNAVAGACELLGIDPLYVANEGKLCAVVAPDVAEPVLAAVRDHPLGVDAAVIGEVRADPPGMVLLETAFGGSRVVDMLAGDPLPRIC